MVPIEEQQTSLPKQIRISLGTAILMGLLSGKLDAKPTTAYIMTYRDSKCNSNCGFCPQARSSQSKTQLLSRVSWPIFPTKIALNTLMNGINKKKIRRLCIQTINYPQAFIHLEAVVKEVRKQSTISISTCCQPKNIETIRKLKAAGVDRIGIALDASNENIFDKIKGKKVGNTYSWIDVFNQIENALEVFGRGNVTTHIIVGVGETEKEALEILEKCTKLGVLSALFAFTPIRGTTLEKTPPPKINSYRRIQLARYLIVSGKIRLEEMSFNDFGEIVHFGLSSDFLEPIIYEATPFRTSGCPDCNRPFYNEKPSGPIYNYPKKPNKEEIKKIKNQLGY